MPISSTGDLGELYSSSMSCNLNKCKELVRRKGTPHSVLLYVIYHNMPLFNLLGLTFQDDCKCFAHIKAKLCKANKCLYAC